LSVPPSTTAAGPPVITPPMLCQPVAGVYCHSALSAPRPNTRVVPPYPTDATPASAKSSLMLARSSRPVAFLLVWNAVSMLHQLPATWIRLGRLTGLGDQQR